MGSQGKNLQRSIADDQELIFAEEDDPAATEIAGPSQGSWKILIVDDEVEVHNVTKLALNDFTFEDKSLTFISAFSGKEAEQLIQAHPDTAIVLLDVVMETENAGLEVVKYIREKLGNQIVRIILRTGQPGQAPENVVVVNYGIDDYKTKTELTSQKLFITVVTALRAFSTLTSMLELLHNPALDLAGSQPAAQLFADKAGEEATNQSPEQPWRSLPQTQLRSVQPEKIAALSQLIAGFANEVSGSTTQSDAFYTMSVLTRIARTVLRITDEHFAKLGISQSKLAVLIYLSGEPELSTSPSTLAKYCNVSRAAMTGLLDGLEQEGYVERNTHPSDRRALMVKLTAKGQEFLDWVVPQDQYRLSELMDALNEGERKKMIDLAIKVMKLFDEQTTVV